MITIKETTFEDIKNIKLLWSDGDVMKFVGFPNGLNYSDEDMKKWFKWIETNRPFLNHYSIFEDDMYCGESFYEIDKVYKSAILDIKLFEFARGRGIANYGLSYAIKEAFKNGAKTVWVDPNPNNIKAINLYKRLGFEIKNFPTYLLPESDKPTSIYMEICKNNYRI